MKVLDFRISIILIVIGVMFFIVSSQDFQEVQTPVTYYLYQPSTHFEVAHNWEVERTINSGASIMYGPFDAYSEGSNVIVLMLQASGSMLIEVQGEDNGPMFQKVSKNFTGSGAGLWLGIWPNDTYQIVIYNCLPSPQFVNGEISVGRTVQETTPVPYTSYYTQVKYGPFYSSRFIWFIMALLGIVIGILTFFVHELFPEN